MDLSMAGEQQLHQIASLSVVAWAQDWMISDVFPWRSQTLHIQRTRLKVCNICVFVTSGSEQVWSSLVDNPYQHIYAFHFISPLLYCLQVHTSSPVTFNLVEFQSNSTTSGFIYEEVPFLLRGFVLEVKSGQTSYIFIFNSPVQPSRLILLARPRSIWRFFKSPIIRDPLWASEKNPQVDGKHHTGCLIGILIMPY